MTLGVWLALGALACNGSSVQEDPPLCSEFSLGQAFDLVQSTAGTHIQLDAALGKDRIWLAYNMTDGEGGSNFDVFLSAVSCAGREPTP